jgi:hypothetical protein
MKPIRLLICGTRTLISERDAIEIRSRLDKILKEGHRIECVISGMANGPDVIGWQWARDNHIPVLEFPAKWKVYRNAAGPIRNQQMLDEGKPTHVIAFRDPTVPSTGTKHMCKIAMKAGIPTKVIDVRWIT